VVKKKVKALPIGLRLEMISEKSDFSIATQCTLANICRSSYYYKPSDKAQKYKSIKKKIYALWEADPSRGARQILHILIREGYRISRKKIREIMQLLGISSFIAKLNLSKPNKEHKKYPYLLRNLSIERPNQVWSTDITYINTGFGKAYLTAIIDWYSRKVLSWRLSNTLDNSFCIEALKEALQKYGRPEIFNTDQGTQYTANNFTQILEGHNIKISMDGKGRALDNIFIERLWRTVKYEHIFLWRFDSMTELRASLKIYFNRYNKNRLHMSLDYNTPDEVYYGKIWSNTFLSKKAV